MSIDHCPSFISCEMILSSYEILKTHKDIVESFEEARRQSVHLFTSLYLIYGNDVKIVISMFFTSLKILFLSSSKYI